MLPSVQLGKNWCQDVDKGRFDAKISAATPWGQLISLINCSNARDMSYPTMCYTNRQTNVPTPLTTLKTQSQAPPVLFLPSTLSATPPPLLWQSQAAEHPQTLLVLFLLKIMTHFSVRPPRFAPEIAQLPEQPTC